MYNKNACYKITGLEDNHKDYIFYNVIYIQQI